jgi:actin-related protein 9
MEIITQYMFEVVHVPGFAIVGSALAASYAHALQDCLVVDIGKTRTEISPVLEFAVVEHAQRSIRYGGQCINDELAGFLPDLTAQQIEDLKRSSIYEVLNEDDTKNSWFGLNPPQSQPTTEEDGVVDIAAIVSSGRTREILAEREKEKMTGDKKKAEPPNMDREFNTFVDSHNRTIEVGKQRFHGTEKLVDRITYAIGEVLNQIDQVNRRQDLWDNIVIVGRGSTVKGLKEAILVSLQTRFIVSRPTTYSELPSTFNTGHNTPNGTPMYNNNNNNNYSQLHQGHGQCPTSMRLAKMADYFPEWKGRGWEDVSFLGGEIAAKQIFTGSIDGTYLSRNDYNEVGPSAIWDM